MNEDKNIVTFKLKPYTAENLEILKKSPDTIIEEAHTEPARKSMIDENAQTNLSYDEFWDGVDL